jgi:hypothetical protein
LIREQNFNLNEFKEGQGKLAQPDDQIYYYYMTIAPNNQVVSAYPLGVELLALPLYAIFSVPFPHLLEAVTFEDNTLRQAAYFSAVVLTVITAFFIYQLLRTRIKTQWIAVVGTLLFIFGTEVISTSSRFLWQHTGTLLLLSLAMLMYEKKKLGYLVLSGVMAAICRPHAVLIVLPLILKLFFDLHLKREKKLRFVWREFLTAEYIISGLLSGLLILGLLMYSYQYFGHYNLLAPHYSSFRFTGQVAPALAGLLFSPSRGLFIFSPFFLLSFWQLIKYRKQNWEYGIGVAAYILLTSCWDMWWGGTSHGYRMLIEIIPTLILFFALYVDENKKQLQKSFWLSSLICTLVGWSVLVQSLWGAQYGDCGFNREPIDINTMNDQQLMYKFWSLKSEVVYCWKKMNAPHQTL